MPPSSGPRRSATSSAGTRSRPAGAPARPVTGKVGTGRNPFQLGGSFVFGPGDVDRYAHVSETFGDSAPVARLLAALGR